MKQFGEQFLKAERYLFLSFKNARKRARKIGTFSAQKWAKLRRNSKKPAKFAGFCSWYLNTTGYMELLKENDTARMYLVYLWGGM